MKVIIKNSGLVFQLKHPKTIVYKNYWVRGSGQYITLTNVNNVKDLAFNNVKVEANIYAGLSSYTTGNNIINARATNVNLRLGGVQSYLQWNNSSYSDSVYTLTPISVGSYQVNANNKTGVLSINGTDYNFNAPASSLIGHIWMFARGTNQYNVVADGYEEGACKVGRIKFYNATTNELVIDLRPALVDGVPCIYDEVTGTELHSDDGTPLVLE